MTTLVVPRLLCLLVFGVCSVGCSRDGSGSEEEDSATDAASAAADGGERRSDAGGGSTDGGGEQDVIDGGFADDDEFDGASPSEPANLEPALSGLEVNGVAVGLKPGFDPETARYSVVALSPADELLLTATAERGLMLEVEGRVAESGVPLALTDSAPGTEIDVVVQNSEGEARTYTVVYLPASFPNLQVTVHEPGASPDPLYVAMRLGSFYYVAKLDNNGVPLFYREAPRAVYDFKKHPGGELSYAQLNEARSSAEHIVMDANFDEVSRESSVGLENTDEHEFLIRPNGNRIFLAYEPVAHDLSPYGGGANQTVQDAVVQEVSPAGEVLFQWSSWENIRWDHTLYGESDYAHVNSVFVDTDGNWLLSSRGTSQVLKVDRETGEVIWRLGGMANEFTFVNDPFENLCGQHTVSRVANGNLLLFDNGQYCWPDLPERGEHTRIVEYALDSDAMTAELVWSYHREGAYTVSQGSSQRLDNGNTLIGWGHGPRMMTTEVDRDGNVVFELEAPAVGGVGRFVSYRSWRVAD